jgi:hypothetical protein
MKKQYQIICMSFDGEYVTERPIFDEIDKAWEYAANLGSKWFFYPFVFVATEKTIIDAGDLLKWTVGKRIKTVKRIFEEKQKRPETEGMDAEEYVISLGIDRGFLRYA